MREDYTYCSEENYTAVYKASILYCIKRRILLLARKSCTYRLLEFKLAHFFPIIYPMKFVALLSGGKDSCFNIMRCQSHGHELICLANLMPLDISTEEMNSFMYQTAAHR